VRKVSHKFRKVTALVMTFVLLAQQPLLACTGILLVAADGSVVYGRTTEWGAFDLKSRIIVIPREIQMVGGTPDEKTGLRWKTKYGVAGIDAVEKNVVVDGMNETGLTVGSFYHPGFAEYQEYLPERADETLGPLDVGTYILTQFASIDEVRAGMAAVRVVPVVEEALGFPAPMHYIVTEPDGDSIVIEYLNGEMTIFDNPLGVITNSPNYDWHMTNLRNYVNLSPVALPGRAIADLDFKPLGGGSGMIGLPGDFTPVSRFVRAVAFSQSARTTADATETTYELFRILDGFNVPLGSAEGSDGSEVRTDGMRSSTVWTTAHDTSNRIFYYHTQHNRRVRSVDLTAIDFGGGTEIVHAPLDREKVQDIEDVTPL